MLVLSRKISEEFVIGHDVRVRILGVHGNRVRVGIVAPASVPVRRTELVAFPDCLPSDDSILMRADPA